MIGSTIKTAQVAQTTPGKVPPLNNGDHLSWAEFRRRYEARPDIKKAELIEGVVYMPSPTRFQQHSEPHAAVIGCLHSAQSTNPRSGKSL